MKAKVVIAEALDAATSSSKTPKVEPGLYAATIVGVQSVTTTYEGRTRESVRFIFQYEDDEGTRFHIAGKQVDFNLYEKSNFAIMMCNITGCANTPAEIAEALKKANLVDEEGCLDWERFIGRHVALMLELKSSKKDPSKSFVNIASIHRATKKTGILEAKAEEIPWFLNEIYSGTVDETVLMKGFSFSEKKSKTSETTTEAAAATVKEDAAPVSVPSAPASHQTPEVVDAKEYFKADKISTEAERVKSESPMSKDDGDFPF